MKNLPKEIKTEGDLETILNLSEDERKAWIASRVAEDDGLKNAGDIGEFVKRKVREAIRESNSTSRPTIGQNRDAPGSELDGKFKSFGEFMKAMTPNYIQRNGMDPRLKALEEGSGGAGGFLVPEEFRATLLEVAIEDSIVRPRATVIPMGSDTLKIPAVHDVSHATNLFGGVQAFWEGEGQQHTASEPTFSQVELHAFKLIGFTQASMELLNDSAVPLESMLTRMFGTALAYFEDEAFIAGSGAGKPLGFTQSDAAVVVPGESGQTAGTLIKENIDKMYARMFGNSRNRAIWIAHPDTIPQLLSLSQVVGTGGSPVMVMNIQNAPGFSVYGRPVVFSEKMQSVGTKGDIAYVDLSFYLIGDRQTVTMSASEHHAFSTDHMTWKFIERVDGRPWLKSPITPRQGSDSLSPIVLLETRS